MTIELFFSPWWYLHNNERIDDEKINRISKGEKTHTHTKLSLTPLIIIYFHILLVKFTFHISVNDATEYQQREQMFWRGKRFRQNIFQLNLFLAAD